MRASGRILLAMLAAMALACCAAPTTPAPFLPATETVIGRASWHGRVVLLTDAPALLTVDPRTADTARIPLLAPGGAEFSPWGLGESNGRLFTVSGFSTLLRLTPEGKVEEPISLPRPITNLLDLADGMAAQVSGEAAGGALAVRLSDAGIVAPLSSPARQGLGLTSAEENLLHLLSCSPPPRVVCWLPNDNRMFSASDKGIVMAARLSAVETTDVNDFVARLDRPTIVDALSLDGGGYAVLREVGEHRREVWVFDAEGNRTGIPAIHEPLRLFVHADAEAVLAVERSGRLARIRIR